MEYIDCILCNENRTEKIFAARDYRYNTSGETFNVVRCKGCGLIFINPRPSKEEMNRYYPDEYRPRKTLEACKRQRRMKKYLNRRNYYFFVNPWHMDFLPGTTVLDIGCGSGELLMRFKELGCNAYGIDVDEVTSSYLCKEMNLDVETCDVDSGTSFKEGFFDVIVMRHSLEHFHNPVRVLQEMRRIIKKNGTLIVGLPNIDSITAKIAGENWRDLDAPRHLFHFSPETIRALMGKAGFSIVDIHHEIKVSRESLKKALPARYLSFLFKSRPLMTFMGFVFSLLHRSEWIVVKAVTEDR